VESLPQRASVYPASAEDARGPGTGGGDLGLLLWRFFDLFGRTFRYRGALPRSQTLAACLGFGLHAVGFGLLCWRSLSLAAQGFDNRGFEQRPSGFI
jgi:hypothetical protein